MSVTEPRPAGSDTTRGTGSTFWAALLSNSRKTERGSGQFLIRFVMRAAPFALLSNSRKTERGAGLFLIRFVMRAAPFALPAGRGSVFVRSYTPFTLMSHTPLDKTEACPTP
jgi:hypothetical protein